MPSFYASFSLTRIVTRQTGHALAAALCRHNSKFLHAGFLTFQRTPHAAAGVS